MWSMDDWLYLEREVVTDPRGRQWTVGLMDVLGQQGRDAALNQGRGFVGGRRAAETVGDPAHARAFRASRIRSAQACRAWIGER